MKTRRQCKDILKVPKENDCQPSMVGPSKRKLNKDFLDRDTQRSHRQKVHTRGNINWYSSDTIKMILSETMKMEEEMKNNEKADCGKPT